MLWKLTEVSEKEQHQTHCYDGQAPDKSLQTGQQKLKGRVYENIA